MKKIEKMLKSENDDVALQNRILENFRRNFINKCEFAF